MSNKAIVVIDMLDDFVAGSLKCDRAQRIIPPLQKLLESARSKGVPVIYSNDYHYPGIDNELKLWGDHAIKGTEAFTKEDYQSGLAYLKQVYGADIKTVDDIVKDF